MEIQIRYATSEDAEKVRDVYAPYILSSLASFEIDVPTVEEMSTRITTIQKKFPWLVATLNGELVGYAYASSHRKRAAYQWSVESGIYLAQKAHRQGIGQALYSVLNQILSLQGFVRVYAGVSLPNDASVRFHESLGFKSIGVYKGVGYKAETWVDVGWWSLDLQASPKQPKAPLLPSAVVKRAATLLERVQIGSSK